MLKKDEPCTTHIQKLSLVDFVHNIRNEPLFFKYATEVLHILVRNIDSIKEIYNSNPATFSFSEIEKADAVLYNKITVEIVKHSTPSLDNICINAYIDERTWY